MKTKRYLNIVKLFNQHYDSFNSRWCFICMVDLLNKTWQWESKVQ